MQLELFIALLLIMPIILFFAVFIWYLNIAGIYSALKELRQKRERLAKNKTIEISKA